MEQRFAKIDSKLLEMPNRDLPFAKRARKASQPEHNNNDSQPEPNNNESTSATESHKKVTE